MTEAERKKILNDAKNFFKTKIAQNHIANTKKLTSLKNFNINPFIHKYLAQFAFGNSLPESMAKVLIIQEYLAHRYPPHLALNFSFSAMRFFPHMLPVRQVSILNLLILLTGEENIAK